MNHYQVLGVKETANPVEIQWAYKALSECNASEDFETQLNISVAYQTLIHPLRRLEYNAEIGMLNNLQAVQQVTEISQPIHLVTNHHHVTPQESSQKHPLTKFIIGFIVAYSAITVLLTVAVAL